MTAESRRVLRHYYYHLIFMLYVKLRNSDSWMKHVRYDYPYRATYVCQGASFMQTVVTPPTLHAATHFLPYPSAGHALLRTGTSHSERATTWRAKLTTDLPKW